MPADPNVYTAGLWSVVKVIKAQAKGAVHVLVLVKYNERLVYETRGMMAWDSAKEQVDRWQASGYVPKTPAVRCMADLQPNGRTSAALKQGNEQIKQRHVGGDFLEGLK